MKRKFYPLFFAGFICFLFGCKTVSKLYEKGNYDEAVELAVKKIQKDADKGEMKALLQNAYRYAVEDHESRIASLSNDNNELKWEWIYDEYRSLQQLYDAIRRSPAASSIIQPADYSSSIATYKDKAGDVRNERGLKWMELNNRESFKKAYREFLAALQFKPGNLDIQQRLNEAYEAAVIHVAIMPMDRFGGYQHSSHRLSDFENDIARHLQYHSNIEFVKFHPGWDARNYRIDQVIELQFNINIGRTRDNRTTREVSKEVVIKEIVYRPDSVVKEYGKVYAEISTTRRTVISQGNLSINIRDAGGHRLWTDGVIGNHPWETEFSTYTGDVRALSEADKRQIYRSEEYPPGEDEIIKSITRNINNDLLRRIRDYYNSSNLCLLPMFLGSK